ncbi:MAG: DUF2291 family protein [Burkholderiales bacterium]|nr:DUF2291 family protein [Phycisphaerae bacterium]
MTRSRRTSRTSWYLRAGSLAAVAVLFWLVPPFRVVNLQAAHRQTFDATFNPSAFVEKLWTELLPKSVDRATDAASLLAAIQQSPTAAKTKHARSAGLGDTYYYFVKGDGRVVAMTKDGISLSFDPDGATAQVILETGNIFGNSIRDGTGVLDVSDFPNSQDFNAISSEINRRIEERVLPGLRGKAVVGAVVRFAGCAQITDEKTDLNPLRVIPLTAEVR